MGPKQVYQDKFSDIQYIGGMIQIYGDFVIYDRDFTFRMHLKSLNVQTFN